LISSDILIQEINPGHFNFAYSKMLDMSGLKDFSYLYIIFENNTLVHVFHSQKGPLNNFIFKGPLKLDAIALNEEVDFVICVDKNAIRRFTSDIQSKIYAHQSFSDQLNIISACFKKENNNGIYIYPDPLSKIPKLPDYSLNLLNILIPPSFFVSLVIMENGIIHSSALIKFKDKEIEFLSTTDSIMPIELNSSDDSANIDVINKAIIRKFGNITAGIYLDRAGLDHVLSDKYPVSSLADLVRSKWAFIKPFPSRLRLIFAISEICRF